MIYTTLNRMKEYKLGDESWEKLLKHLGKTETDDEPLGFDVILKVMGLDCAIWYCRSVPEYNHTWRLLAKRYANGQTTEKELDNSWETVCDTARVAAWHTAQETAWDIFQKEQKEIFISIINKGGGGK